MPPVTRPLHPSSRSPLQAIISILCDPPESLNVPLHFLSLSYFSTPPPLPPLLPHPSDPIQTPPSSIVPSSPSLPRRLPRLPRPPTPPTPRRGQKGAAYPWERVVVFNTHNRWRWCTQPRTIGSDTFAPGPSRVTHSPLTIAALLYSFGGAFPPAWTPAAVFRRLLVPRRRQPGIEIQTRAARKRGGGPLILNRELQLREARVWCLWWCVTRFPHVHGLRLHLAGTH